VQVDARELLRDLIEQATLGELFDLRCEIEPLEDVTGGGRKCLHIGEQVFPM